MKLLAIDGNSIMNRAFYGIKLLSNKNGDYTNAITGFMNIYLKVIADIKPDAVACAFDLRAKTFRHLKVESYKATRKGMPDELAAQMPIIKKLLSALGVSVLEKEGFEADDILGTLAKISENSGNECYVLTGDKDSLQLITEKVTVLLHGMKGIVNYTPDVFRENYGFEPINLIDLKALMGDSSDNISGVRGIGEKTATALISEYTTIENLYENLAEGKVTAGKAALAKLEVGKDDATLSKWLATIVTDVPIPSDFSEYVLKEQNSDEIAEILSRLEMFKMLDRLGVSAVEIIRTEEKSAETKPAVEYTIKDFSDEVFSEILAEKSLVSFILTENSLHICYGNILTEIPLENKDSILKFLSSPLEKISFRAKTAYKFCLENGTTLTNLKYDLDILGYLLNSSSSEYSIENLCSEHAVKFYREIEKFSDLASIPALCDAMICETKKTEMYDLLEKIEMPLVEVLATMEFYGVAVSKDGIEKFGEKLSEDIAEIERKIYEIVGHEFKINSPKQLGIILFEELSLPVIKKNKSGYSTNAEVLEQLQNHHEIVPLVQDYRHLTKLNSTYVVGLLKVISNGRIHSIFKQTETKTGRISSVEPNLQNIPIRTELGRSMRKFFVAKDGYVLLDADYSQIELRILAALSGDENMRNSFISGEDIHTQTASQIFDIPAEMITSEMRRAAKAVNFGIVYGIGAFSLSKDIDVSVADAERYIKSYFATYPSIKKYLDETVQNAVDNLYSVTYYGRRRYIPELKNSNKNIAAFGKRVAMNAPIQGTAADIIKIAMIKVFNRLRAEKLDATLILQVHDELIIEVSNADKEKAAKILEEEMIGAASLSVPLVADVKSGETWYDAKD